MKIGYFIEGAYDKLFDSMESNRDKYKMKTPWIKDYFKDTDFFVETNIEFPPFKLINTGDKTKDDFQNTVTLYNALGKILSPRQACNKYMWSYLAQDTFYEYASQRWPVEKGAAIKTRYFCGESRIALSLNAISRLWWYGHLTYDEENPTNPYHLTELLTSNTDLCQNLIQHSYSMNKNVTLGFLDAVEEFINDGNDFTEDIERQTIKFVNRYGGVVVIDVLSRTEIKKLVYDYMKKKSRNDME